MKDSITEDQASMMIIVKASLYEQFLEKKVWENERKSKKVKERERERERGRERKNERKLLFNSRECFHTLHLCPLSGLYIQQD